MVTLVQSRVNQLHEFCKDVCVEYSEASGRVKVPPPPPHAGAPGRWERTFTKVNEWFQKNPEKVPIRTANDSEERAAAIFVMNQSKRYDILKPKQQQLLRGAAWWLEIDRWEKSFVRAAIWHEKNPGVRPRRTASHMQEKAAARFVNNQKCRWSKLTPWQRQLLESRSRWRFEVRKRPAAADGKGPQVQRKLAAKAQRCKHPARPTSKKARRRPSATKEGRSTHGRV